MRQLPLDIRLAEHAVFESFHPGPNALAVDSLRRLAGGDGAPVIWLWGARGSGRSHLLQATVAAADGVGSRAAYLPLGGPEPLDPGVVEGLGDFALVALDDAGAVAGQERWERALLRLYEDLLPRGGRILAAGLVPPSQAGFALRDLSSRFAAGGVFRLESLADDDLLVALQRRANWRGFSLPDETGRYLLARVDRNLAGLFRMLDRLDQAALAAQKRLTIPFVRSVLESG